MDTHFTRRDLVKMASASVLGVLAASIESGAQLASSRLRFWSWLNGSGRVVDVLTTGSLNEV